MKIELQVMDIPEVREAITEAVREGLKGAAQKTRQGWLNMQGVAECYGISVEQLYKKPWLCPPKRGTEDGAPDSQHIYRADETWDLVFVADTKRQERWKRRLISSGKTPRQVEVMIEKFKGA